MINRQKLQSFIDSYKDKFIKELNETCKDLLDTNDTNLIDLDQEYDISKCKYIKTEPMIHLDVDKLVTDIDNNNCDIHNLTRNELLMIYDKRETIDFCRRDITINEIGTIKINFPINIILNKNEYVIKLYLVSINKKIDYSPITKYDISLKKYIFNDSPLEDYHRRQKYWYEQNNCKDIFSIVYITNYGRIIKSEDIFYYIYQQEICTTYGNNCRQHHQHSLTTNNFKVIEYNKLINRSLTGYTSYERHNDLGEQEIKLIPQPELNYKMPKIFIDVIDAFHTQNTDLMQSCCKKYLDILNKTKSVDKIIEKDKIIKNQQEQLLEKDKEIERLKLEMEELKKFYIDS
jgi:hypothetical protein